MAKRFLKTAVVSALFALTLAVSASAASAGGATTTTAVNFRTGAGTNYGIISTLPAGTHVVVSSQSSGASLACLMMDIDHFKEINDTFGHAAGDAVLRQLAAILRSAARTEDMVFRYGGEEFTAILTNATPKIAAQVAERIRLQVENAEFVWHGQRISVTLSIGVALAENKTQNEQTLIQEADKALYQARKSGRNRVSVNGDLQS